MSTRRAPRRTLWEEGRHRGRLVVHAAAAATLLVVLANLAVAGRVTVLFDLAFVLLCVTGALAVRPRDFFVVGVLPPLLMAGTVLVLALTARGAIAEAGDGLVQAMVSGLAHHSGSLVAGYGLTLAVLAIRQVALRNAGVLRGGARPAVPQQRAARYDGTVGAPAAARPRLAAPDPGGEAATPHEAESPSRVARQA